MDYIRDFLVLNFPLLCVVFGMTFVIIYDYKTKNKNILYFLAILYSALLLAVLLEFEVYFKDQMNEIGCVLTALLGYTIRPIVLYLFIRLGSYKKNKKELFLIIPLVINFLVYCSALFIGIDFGKIAFYYSPNDTNTALVHVPGTLRLNYTGHFISLALLGYLIYQSTRRLKNKHFKDAFAILSCSLFTIIAVVVESFTSREGLLNNTIGISAIFYYMFVINLSQRKDQLTGLFDRKTFFDDKQRFFKSVTCIIQLDMNGLKLINDNEGHSEGDKALALIGKVINTRLTSTMYGYRLGGDEFVIFSCGDKEETVKEFISQVREDLSKTKYSCSIGYIIRDEEHNDFKSMMKASEADMYKDKSDYYISNHIDRRKR